MEDKDKKRLIEAALFMAGRSLSIEKLSKICQTGSIGMIRRKVEELKKDFSERDSSIEIRDTHDGYRMKVDPELEKEVANLAPVPEISPAILKILALIAYRQPVTQAEIVKERGNRAYKYIKKLIKKEFISAEKHGRTKMLRTTSKFKDYFKIKDLSKLKDIKKNLNKVKKKERKDA